MPERPIHDMLLAQQGRERLHMPGHKGRAPFGPADLWALDTTELPETDCLYQPAGAIARAQALYARAAGAGASLFLHGGSTSGIHAMLMGFLSPGDTVILPRSAHLSAVNACVLGGLRIRWIPLTQLADGYVCVSEADALRVIADTPEARAVLLTRPDYFGACMPLRRVAEAARRAGMRLLVDEAHGAHLPWLGEPASAGALGADAWVQSVHKTLPGLTGCAVLHVRRPEDAPLMNRVLRRGQTSSPSFVLLRAIDDARAWMEASGAGRLPPLTDSLCELRGRLPGLGYEDAHPAWQSALPGFAFDPTRLVICAPQGGRRLQAQLAAERIDVEMCDDRRVVCIFTAMDSPAEAERLAEALGRIPPEAAAQPAAQAPLPLPRAVMPPREAALGPTRLVPMSQAAGQIAAESVGLYPPGVPLAVPGEILDSPILNRLAQARPGDRFGMEGDMLRCADV